MFTFKVYRSLLHLHKPRQQLAGEIMKRAQLLLHLDKEEGVAESPVKKKK